MHGRFSLSILLSRNQYYAASLKLILALQSQQRIVVVNCSLFVFYLRPVHVERADLFYYDNNQDGAYICAPVERERLAWPLVILNCLSQQLRPT